jgi:adenosylhomocysteine/aminodeoxyfutalosine nucleosidase
MKIGILGAMEEEITPLLEIFKDYEKIEYANNTYYKTKYKSFEIIIAYSKIGKVFSTISACVMIEKFGCEKILFSGVAGGINKNLKIGDLIIANKLCQYDLDITAFGHPHGFVPGGSVFVSTDDSLNKIAKKVADDIGVSLIEGTIATGDLFVSDSSKKDFIEKEFKADALEMEGASVAVVCDSLNIPCLILRAISDTADTNADMDFDEFLNKSAKQSANFLIKILDYLK